MKKGDKLVCLETINNMLGNPLFIMGKTYTILSVDDDEVFCRNYFKIKIMKKCIFN